ncbi:MAG: DUF3592 domain-containing protein [Anaerolineaceae bacterium]|nr:DUF3592 domain-containing protein [Anaerolineaceae bacterium]
MNWNESFIWLFGGGTTLAVILSILLSVICTSVPVVLVIWYILRRKKKATSMLQDSRSRLTTTGKIIKSRVEVSGGEVTSVQPRVIYEYSVGATIYQGEQIKAGGKFWSAVTSRDAYNIVDRYPEGMTVTVYYDPENPAESALER